MSNSQELPEAYTLSPADAATAETHRIETVEEPIADAEPHPPVAWMLLRELVETVVLALVIFLLIRLVVQNYRIESHSMLPNFHEGQFILVNKLAYKLGAPKRGDVVVFHNPQRLDEDYIKRVIGLPGDTVEVIDQTIYINQQPLDEPFPHNSFAPGEPYGPTVVGPNQIFVMGDNRGNSQDSRVFGPLDEDLLVGKAWFRIWPFSAFGPIHHYDLVPVATAATGP